MLMQVALTPGTGLEVACPLRRRSAAADWGSQANKVLRRDCLSAQPLTLNPLRKILLYSSGTDSGFDARSSPWGLGRLLSALHPTKYRPCAASFVASVDCAYRSSVVLLWACRRRRRRWPRTE